MGWTALHRSCNHSHRSGQRGLRLRLLPPQLQLRCAGRLTRSRHRVDAPALAPKDARALLRRDSSPDPPSLSLGPSPDQVVFRRNRTRNGRNGAYVPRRSNPEDGGGSGDDSDSLVPILFPCAVLGSTVTFPRPGHSTGHRSPSRRRSINSSAQALLRPYRRLHPVTPSRCRSSPEEGSAARWIELAQKAAAELVR